MVTKQQMQAAIESLSEMFQLVVKKTEGPTQSLFDAYNAILALPADQIQNDKSEQTSQIQQSLETFKKIRKDLKAACKAEKLPVSMQLPLTGARDRALQYVNACISACESLLEHLETTDPEHLEEAHRLLEPMSS